MRAEITNSAQVLSARRVAHMQAGFPLTTAQIQHALVPEEDLSALRRLDVRGVHDLPKTRGVTISLLREEWLGLPRSVAINLELTEQIFVARSTRGGWYNSTTFNPSEQSSWTLPLAITDPAERDELVAWANLVVREQRLKEIADWTVKEVLRHCDSTGDLLATWPLLTTLVKTDYWVSRLRAPPVKMHRYAPSVAVMAKFDKAMRATEVVLTSAEMLENYKHPEGTVRAQVLAWERLAHDRIYTL